MDSRNLDHYQETYENFKTADERLLRAILLDITKLIENSFEQNRSDDFLMPILLGQAAITKILLEKQTP